MTIHSKDIKELEESIYKLVGRIKYGQQQVDLGRSGWEKGIEDIIEAEKELVSLIESLNLQAKIEILKELLSYDWTPDTNEDPNDMVCQNLKLYIADFEAQLTNKEEKK